MVTTALKDSSGETTAAIDPMFAMATATVMLTVAALAWYHESPAQIGVILAIVGATLGIGPAIHWRHSARFRAIVVILALTAQVAAAAVALF